MEAGTEGGSCREGGGRGGVAHGVTRKVAKNESPLRCCMLDIFGSSVEVGWRIKKFNCVLMVYDPGLWGDLE